MPTQSQYRTIKPGYALDKGANYFTNPSRLLDATLLEVDLAAYPHTPTACLLQALSGFLGVDADRITLGSGSQDLIDLIFQTYLKQGSEIIITDATYEWYAAQASHYGATVVTVPTRNDFSIQSQDLLAAQNSKTRLIIIDSPSNPFGAVLPAAALRQMARQSSALIIIDEEYIEFGGMSLLREIKELNNVIILRSFSKWAGLAGIRIGYAIASTDITQQLTNRQLPHPISSPSAHIATRAIEQAQQILKFLPVLARSRDVLVSELTDLGLWVWSQNTPYLVTCGHDDATTCLIHAGLHREGVSTKLYRAKGRQFIRITIPPLELTQTLIEIIHTHANATYIHHLA
jgi:histidinol-phosphate aminotransferase